MIFNKLSNFQQRILVSVPAVIFTLGLIFYSHHSSLGILFPLFSALIIGAVVWEYYHIAQLKGFQPLTTLGVIGSAFYLFATYWSSQTALASILPVIVLAAILLLGFLYYFISGVDPFVNLSITFFGLLYLTIPLSFMISINYFFVDSPVQDGRWWLIYLLAVTKATDIGAYFTGKQFGKHKLSPYISPKKTWEGAVGGFIASLIVSLIFAYLSHENLIKMEISIWQSLWLAVLVSILAQIGDLAESLLKRNMGVKDSNHLLPGLGGALDMVDSLVFTTPLVYIVLRLQYGDFL